MAKPRTIGNMIAPPRFLAFLVMLAVSFPILAHAFDRWALGAMSAFDIAATLFLLLCLPLLSTSEAAEIRAHAVRNDANRQILLAITGIVMAVLLTAIAAEAVGHNPQPVTKALIIGTLALAWLFSNFIYALHYAHLAYLTPSDGCCGFDFPGTDEPDYWDFVRTARSHSVVTLRRQASTLISDTNIRHQYPTPISDTGPHGHPDPERARSAQCLCVLGGFPD